MQKSQDKILWETNFNINRVHNLHLKDEKYFVIRQIKFLMKLDSLLLYGKPFMKNIVKKI